MSRLLVFLRRVKPHLAALAACVTGLGFLGGYAASGGLTSPPTLTPAQQVLAFANDLEIINLADACDRLGPALRKVSQQDCAQNFAFLRAMGPPPPKLTVLSSETRGEEATVHVKIAPTIAAGETSYAAVGLMRSKEGEWLLSSWTAKPTPPPTDTATGSQPSTSP